MNLPHTVHCIRCGKICCTRDSCIIGHSDCASEIFGAWVCDSECASAVYKWHGLKWNAA